VHQAACALCASRVGEGRFVGRLMFADALGVRAAMLVDVCYVIKEEEEAWHLHLHSGREPQSLQSAHSDSYLST